MSKAAENISHILESIPDAVIAIDTNGYFTYVNSKAAQFFGKPVDHLTGKCIWLEFPSEKDRDFYLACQRVMETKQQASIEICNELQGKWVQKNIYPLQDGLTVFFREIIKGNDDADKLTEIKLKEAEKKIREASERFELVTRATNDMIWDWNLVTDDIWWNYNYNNFFGYDNAELHHIRSWMDSIHPDDRQRVIDGIYKVINLNEKYWSDEYRYLKNDGTVLFIHDRGYVSYNEQGQPYRMIGSMLNISDRIKAEQAIKDSEERYRILVEQASDAIFIINEEGNFTTANTSACELSQYSQEELLKMSVFDFALFDDLQKNPFRFEELKQGKTVITERPMQGRYGNQATVEVTSKMLSDGRILVFVRNITERIKAQQALQDSEEKYRTLVEQAADGIYITDTNGRIITVNSSACKLSGYSKTEMEQMSVYDFVLPEDLQKEPLRFKELEEGKTVIVKRRFKIKNGGLLNVECIANMLSDGRILVFARDISERLLAEEAIRESEEKYRTLVEQASDGIYIADSKGRIVSVNQSTCRISQFSEEELLQMTIYDFVPKEDLEKYPLRFDELRQGKTVVTERRMIQRDGNLLDIENTTKLLSDGRILIFVRDISERIRAQQLLEKSYEDIRRLASHLTQAREEERKRIGREIHDELGQQLTAIKMDVAWIDKKTTDETNPIKSNLKNILTMLDGTNQSVRRILTGLNPGIIDNDGLLDAIARQNRQFTETTGKPVEFTSTESKIILSQEIANCIFRVYQESLTNIMRYAKANKVVTSLKIMDGSIIVTIEDDGIGFDINAVRAKRSFGILGMRERVLSQKGSFELYSEKTKGTKITITLPCKTLVK